MIIPSHPQQLDVIPDENILLRHADLIIEKEFKWESSPIIHENPSITMYCKLLSLK
jgi:hypothetical protein